MLCMSVLRHSVIDCLVYENASWSWLIPFWWGLCTDSCDEPRWCSISSIRADPSWFHLSQPRKCSKSSRSDADFSPDRSIQSLSESLLSAKIFVSGLNLIWNRFLDSWWDFTSEKRNISRNVESMYSMCRTSVRYTCGGFIWKNEHKRRILVYENRSRL